MLTKKDFEREAVRIYDIEDAEKAWEEMDIYSKIFKESNPRFDEGKFVNACGFVKLEANNEERNYEENAKF